MPRIPPYPRVASFSSAGELAAHLEKLGWPLPFDAAILTAPDSPLAQPLEIPWRNGSRRVGNRWAVQPMEGWDGEADGRPSALTRRRWLRFSTSGAKLLWGCEAVAVLPEARANPDQLLLEERTASDFAALRKEMVCAHRERFGTADDLLIGLQLTHSGRFSRPHEEKQLEPIIAYHHPILDAKFPPSAEQTPVSDPELGRAIKAFARAARLAGDAGFDFIDLKHCHGYLGHELLGAKRRPGPFGGSFENRTRFLREAAAAVRASAPDVEIGVRLSAFDSVPFVEDAQTHVGVPAVPRELQSLEWGFGIDARDPSQPDLSDAKELLRLMIRMEIHLVNISAGSPYYCPHVQRPALFPPCDAYLPPEDPLAGAARLVAAARELKLAAPDLVIVSSGWSYLQNYLPHFAQAAVREGLCDFAGLGRMMLAYPELPADVLERGRLDPKRICRTFSDCTNGPRHGMVSGCYPLDPFYRAQPEAGELQSMRSARWT